VYLGPLGRELEPNSASAPPPHMSLGPGWREFYRCASLPAVTKATAGFMKTQFPSNGSGDCQQADPDVCCLQCLRWYLNARAKCAIYVPTVLPQSALLCLRGSSLLVGSLGQNIGFPKLRIFEVFLSPARHIREYCRHYSTASSFRNLSDPIHHPNIRLYVVWVTEYVVKRPTV
jgi:hypothetical protein